MSVLTFWRCRANLLRGSAIAVALGFATATAAQTQLPEVVVRAPKEQEKPKPKPTQVRAAPRPALAPAAQPVLPGAQLNAEAETFDQARSNLFTTIGTTSSVTTQSTINALPGGDNTPVKRILLQAPGVTQDSAASGLLHVRNDHANVQFRINGVMLPDGRTGFGSILDASWIGSMALVVGAFPADSGCHLGVDVYYKIATDLIDNGLFGQAYVLSAFNYAHGINEGIEFSGKFHSGNFQAYANLAIAQQRATGPVSNQYLFGNTPIADLGGLTEFQYLQTHWIYTDHTQFVTASAGAIYQFCGRPAYANETFGGAAGGFWTAPSWCGTRLTGDMIYGSGLRRGDPNISTVPQYTQFNLGIARGFLLPDDPKPMTVRFDIINLFDTVYQIRSGSGIGVIAPQYGPRRGFFAGVSKKF